MTSFFDEMTSLFQRATVYKYYMADRVTVNLSTWGNTVKRGEAKVDSIFPKVDKFTVTLSDMSYLFYYTEQTIQTWTIYMNHEQL